MKEDDKKPGKSGDAEVIPFKPPRKSKRKAAQTKTKGGRRSASRNGKRPSKAKSGAKLISLDEARKKKAAKAEPVPTAAPAPSDPDPSKPLRPMNEQKLSPDDKDGDGRPYHSAANVRVALEFANGKLSEAADILGIKCGSLRNRLTADPELKALAQSLRAEFLERQLDEAERTVEWHIRDPKVAIAFLSRRGAARGWSNKIEASVSEKPLANAEGDAAVFDQMDAAAEIKQRDAEIIRLRQKYEPEAYAKEQAEEVERLKKSLGIGVDGVSDDANGNRDAG